MADADRYDICSEAISEGCQICCTWKRTHSERDEIHNAHMK